MRIFSLALIASLGLVGCVGGIDSPPPSDDPGGGSGSGVGGGGSGSAAAEARQLFEASVEPIMSAKCLGCHSVAGPVGNITGFVDTDPSAAYATLSGYQAVVGDYTASAPILTKLSTGSHSANAKGVAYTPDEITLITSWLTKELDSRVGGGPNPTPTGESAGEATVRLTKEWSGCMDLVNFQTANMKAWGNVNANNGGNCKTCHYNGEYGMIAENQDTPFFDTIASDKYYMAQYFSVDLTGGVAAAKVIINTRSFAGVGTGIAPHQSHPRFDPENNNGMAALQEFYDLTVAAKAAAPAGVCGPPKLLN